MAIHYDLPFRLRFILFLLRFIRPKARNLSLEKIRKIRKPFPIKILAHWVLGKPIPIFRVEDRMIPVRDAEIPVRIYWPSEAKDLPLIMNYHGGGWTLGNLQQSDFYCRYICKHAGVIVVSVDYRLAPDHPFPIPLQDAYDSLLWAHDHAAELGGNPAKLAVTGDSAGGNLSAVVALMARDQKGPKLTFMGLIYPATDGTFNYPSYTVHANAPILSQDDINFYHGCYEDKEGDHLNPYFSPYLADDLSHLPPSLVITAEYDPLVDDGVRFAERLKNEGNEVTQKTFAKAIHGFITLVNHCPQSFPAMELLVKYFKKYLF